MKLPHLSFALRTALLYALGASLWILFEERLLGATTVGASLHTNLAIPYDASFVLITTPLIYLYLARNARAHAKLAGELRASAEKCRSFVEQLGEGVALVDEAGRIIEWNPTWERWSGLARADAIGKLFWDIQLQSLPPDQRTPERAEHFKQLTLEALQAGEAPILKPPTDTTLTRPDGGQIQIEQIIFPIKTELGYRLGAVSRDVTERKRIEAALRRANRALQAISACDQALAHATDEPALLTAICRVIVEVNGYRMAWIGFAEHDTAKSVRPMAQAGFEAGYLQIVSSITWADAERGRGPTGTAIRTGTPCLARNIPVDSAYGPWRAAAIQRGYQSSIALPLIAQGQTLGALSIYAAEPDAFDADEVRLLAGLADDLALGIVALRVRAEQAKAARALRESERRYRLISENTGDVIWTLDLATGRFTYVSPSVYRLRGFTPEEVLAQTVAEALTPESYADVMAILRKRLPAFAAGDDSQRISIYEVDQPCKDGAIVPTEVVTTLLTDEAGNVVEILGVTRDMTAHKRAEAEIRRHAEELAALYATSLDLTMPHNLPDLLHAIVERAARLLNATSGGLYLCEPERQQVRCVVSYNTLRDFTGVVLKYGEGIAGVVAQTGQPLIIDDYRVWPGRAAVFEEDQPFSAVLSAPLIWQGRVTGVIHVLHDTQTRRFTQADQELLTLFAHQAAIAVENARLLEALEQRAEELALLNRVGLAITSGLELTTVLSALDAQCRQVLPIDCFYVALYDAQNGVFRFPLFRDAERDVEMPPQDVRARPGLTSEVIQRRQTLYVADTLDPHALDGIAITRAGGSPARSYVGVPLVLRDAVIGVMSMQNYQPNAYTPEQIRLLETIAAQAAIAVENASLYEAARHYVTELEQRVAARTEDLAQREAALQAANAELQKLDQLKNTFIANISHELRTPLTVLKSYHYLMEHGNPEKRDAYMETLNRETDLLWRLIENLLDISRLELGLPLPELAPVDLNRLVTLLTGDRQPLFAERGVMLQLEMEPGLAACAADRTMLTEVLTNLLTNAMLYTPAGGTVTVRTGRPMADGAWPIAPDDLPAASVHQPSRWVTVAVIDTGPGMSLEEQAHIFERFYRGEAARNLNLPGTGLGLSICHDVMQRHGGQITVASAIGQGSTFTLWLPAA